MITSVALLSQQDTLYLHDLMETKEFSSSKKCSKRNSVDAGSTPRFNQNSNLKNSPDDEKTEAKTDKICFETCLELEKDQEIQIMLKTEVLPKPDSIGMLGDTD